MSDRRPLTTASLVVGWDEERGLSWAGTRDRPGQVPPPTRLSTRPRSRGGHEGVLVRLVGQVQSETLVDAGPLRWQGFAEDVGESAEFAE
jgi:hypothetical protein